MYDDINSLKMVLLTVSTGGPQLRASVSTRKDKCLSKDREGHALLLSHPCLCGEVSPYSRPEVSLKRSQYHRK